MLFRSVCLCVEGNTGLEELWAQDCNSDCFGAAFEDDCGICSGGFSDHVANSDQDCAGTCPEDEGFGAEADDCGVCGGLNVNLDCANVCFGTAFEDDCGECSGGTSDHVANSDKDCAGTCPEDEGFGAFVDDCGECSDGLSGHETNSNQDCNSDCFGNALVDE